MGASAEWALIPSPTAHEERGEKGDPHLPPPPQELDLPGAGLEHSEGKEVLLE